MTVVNPKSISGINSITAGTGSDNLVTIHTGDTTERVRITSAGRLGVGENSPDTLLHLKDTTSATVKLITLNSSTVRNNYIGLNSADNLEIGVDEDAEGGDSSIRFRVDGSEKVRMSSDGYVGIGSDAPAQALDILNTSSAVNISLRNTSNSFNSFIFDTNRTGADDNLSLIDAKWNGNVVSRIQFKTGSDTTNKDDGAIALHTRTSGSALSESVRIDTAGNVGINSTSPVSKLDVIGDAKVSGIVTATTFVPTQGQLSNRNLIINGAMKIAQRATSSTDGDGYNTVDRYRIKVAGTDEAITQTQHALTSSDTGPWEEGFRHSWHFQNGNQTSGVGADDVVAMQQRIEAQNVATSGWDYTSSSSYLTLSFWVKSSVAQNFYGMMRSLDGTAQNYPFETGSLSANTWTKITKVIPGNSNITMDNNNDYGIHLEWVMYRGTNTTGSVSLNTWAAYSSTARNPDCTSTWYTTNDSTFELTGVQLEVGQAATPFEHHSYGDELARCQRYYCRTDVLTGQNGAAYGKAFSTSEMFTTVCFPTSMRATPTITTYNNAGTAAGVHKLGNPDITSIASIDRADTRGFGRINKTSAWATGDTDMYSFTWEASAEL